MTYDVEQDKQRLNESNANLTVAAIEEGRRIAADPSIKGYTDMDELKAALED